MSEINVLMLMTLEKTRRIEEVITNFLGHKPSWQERKAFSILNKLDESSIYHKGEHLATVTCANIDDPI